MANDQLLILREAFDALTLEYRLLSENHNLLERKLKIFTDKLASHSGKSNTNSETINEKDLLPSLIAQLSDVTRVEISSEECVDRIATSSDLVRRKRAVHIAEGIKLLSQFKPTAYEEHPKSEIEKDFTIPGTPSKLGCPFASMNSNKPLNDHAAKIVSRYHASNRPRISVTKDSLSSEKSSHSRSLSASRKDVPCPIEDLAQDNDDPAAAGICPIRLLDQQSPEEVATYFEQHKHELPRSHKVCVKRYQSNASFLRELDAKYGSLVGMIEGLAAKHQPMLPTSPQDEIASRSVKSEKVREWVDQTGQTVDNGIDDTIEERIPHFDRNLKDIRVGESPSRPWGISVPIDYEPTHKSKGTTNIGKSSTLPREQHQIMDNVDVQPRKAQCPAGFRNLTQPVHQEPPVDEQQDKTFPALATGDKQTALKPLPGSSNSHSPYVFTGPVFVGYSVEDAARILKLGST